MNIVVVSKPPRKRQRPNFPKKADETKPTKSQLRNILSSLKSDKLGSTEFGHSPLSREFTFSSNNNNAAGSAVGNSDTKIDPHQVFVSLKEDSDDSTNSSNLGEILPVFTEPPAPSRPSSFLDAGGGSSTGGEALSALVPGQPQDLKAVIVKARFVTLSWKPPDVTRGEILAYSVYYRQEGSQR